MAYCNQTLAGIPLDCGTNKGGIKTVYIANYGDVASVEVGDDGKISTILMVKERIFTPYQFRKQTGSMTSTLTADDTSGINYVTTELSLIFTKQETAKRLEMSALALGQLAVIVEDSNGKYWYLGKDDYVSASAGGATTGTAKGDSNNYSLTLKDESDTFPIEVTEEALGMVIGGK